MTTETTVVRNSKIKPRVKGFKALFTHQGLRRLIQAGFALFILYVTYVHVTVGEDSGIITASPEAFCPFGGMETLYNFIISGGKTIQHTHLSNLVVAASTLVVALVFRSAFCGWICPLGTIQDWIHSFSSLLQKKFMPIRKFFRWASEKGQPVWNFLDRILRFVKYGVLAWALSGAAIYGYMVFKDFDPWSALLTITEWVFTPGLVVLGITLVGSLFVERPWCRYACPLGAASGLLGKLSPMYLKREADACTNCKICTKSCPMGLEVHTATTITSVDCISCLECVGDCPRECALELKMGLPLTAK